jgi:NCAIR mutase (PurE)-related protein
LRGVGGEAPLALSLDEGNAVDGVTYHPVFRAGKDDLTLDKRSTKTILERLESGRISLDEALDALKGLPYEDLGFAKIDHHRSLRTGIPEVVYAEGKKPEQVAAIMAKIVERSGFAMATRASGEIFRAVENLPGATYHEQARIIEAGKRPVHPQAGNVAVVCAGTSDIPIAEEAAVTAEILGDTVDRVYDVGVAGLHRLLDHRELLEAAQVLIVVAGMEGALASVVGALVPGPVVAVPTSVGYGAAFDGLAALLGMLNSCVPGVAVVNIDNGFGAACFAHLVVSAEH